MMPISTREGEQSPAGRVGRLILFGIVGIFDLAVAIGLTIAYRRWHALGEIDPGALIFIFVFGGISLFLTLLLIRNVISRTVYDELDLILAQESLPLGGEQQVTIKLRAKRALQAKEIVLRLLKQEKAVNRAGTRSTTYLETTAIETKVLRAQTWLSPMEPLEIQETLRVPKDAPPTISTRNTDLVWLAELLIKVARWPDARMECIFNVQPEVVHEGRTEEAGEA